MEEGHFKKWNLVKFRALQSKSTSKLCPENRAEKFTIFLISIFRRMYPVAAITKGREGKMNHGEVGFKDGKKNEEKERQRG